MPVLSSTGHAACGVGNVALSVDGAVPAALAAITGGEPHWFSPNTLVFHNVTSGGIWFYNTTTLALTFLGDLASESRLAAGGGIYAAWVGDSLRTSVGGFGPFTGQALGDVSEAGIVTANTVFETSTGVTVYSAAGAVLCTIPDLLTPYNYPIPCRSGLFMYSTATGWKLRDTAGTLLPCLAATNIDYVKPFKLASGAIGLIERSATRLVCRFKDQSAGYIIKTAATITNPDIIELTPGVVRIAWSTDAAESASTLQLMDLTLATGANQTAVVVASALVWTTQAALVLTPGVAIPAYTDTRYFRYRYIERSGTTILRRSEPSDATTFAPSGAGVGATIARIGSLGEGETDWELEASTDGSTFYRVQTLPIAQSSTTDQTNLVTETYAQQGPVSESIGTYLLQPAAKYLAADADRLLMGSHPTDLALQSRVSWTPVFADPGVGNDERLPLATGGDNFIDLDNYDGGGLTGISQMTNGTWYAFKWGAIYKLARTGDITHAYDPICITKARGALPDSIIGGVDEAGRACLYFLDPAVGPCSLGAAGLRTLDGLRNTWKQVAVSSPEIACRVCYYGDKQQVHWWVATGGSTRPTLKLVLQVNHLTQANNGSARRGWALADGPISTATAVSIWHETTVEGGVECLRARPFVGLTDMLSIQRCDVGDTDNGTEYHAKLRTGPYFLTGLLNRWGAMTTAVLATASATISLVVSCLRGFGIETTTVTTPLTPEADEPYVVKSLDNLAMSEAHAAQFQFEDV